jgi:hypothetical protein
MRRGIRLIQGDALQNQAGRLTITVPDLYRTEVRGCGCGELGAKISDTPNAIGNATVTIAADTTRDGKLELVLERAFK